MEKVSTINQKKQVWINILPEESTTVDTWYHNTENDICLTTHVGVPCIFSNSSGQSTSALGQSMFNKTLALSQGFRVNAFSKRLKHLAQF